MAQKFMTYEQQLNKLQAFDYIHHSKQVKRLVDSLSKTIAIPSHYRYIAHHARKYHNQCNDYGTDICFLSIYAK